MNNKERAVAILLLIAAGIAWGLTPALIKIADYDGEGVAAFRMVLSSIFLGSILFSRRKVLWQGRLTSKAQLVAGLAAAVSTTTFALACSYTLPSHVYLLYYLYPIVLLAADLRIDKKPSIRQIAFVCLAVLGLFIFASSSLRSPAIFIGDLYAIISALSWALYVVLSRSYLSSKNEVLAATVAGQIIAFLLFFPFVSDLAIEPDLWPSLQQFFWILIFGVSSTIPLLAWAYAVHIIPGHVAGVITMIEAPVGVTLCWIFFATPVGVAEFIGGVIIVTAAACLSIVRK